MAAKRTCSVEGCDNPHKARGWCHAHYTIHYQRWVRADGERTRCSVDDCNRVAEIRGWCILHYGRWRNHGDPLKTHRTGRTVVNGYVRIRIPGHPLADSTGIVAEHRLVVWEAGIDPRGQYVHHINGDRANNRIENLEVITAAEHNKIHKSGISG